MSESKPKPKFEIGQTVHTWQPVNIVYDVIDCRWDDVPKRRSFLMMKAEPNFQYLLGNERFINTEPTGKGTIGWINECNILSLLEMKEEIKRYRDDDDDALDRLEPEYDADTGKAFINGEWVQISQGSDY